MMVRFIIGSVQRWSELGNLPLLQASSIVIWLLVCDDLAAAEGWRRLSTAQEESKIRNDSASLTHDSGGVFTIKTFE